jgi:hypothetical protein
MGAANFEDLMEHDGHKIEIVTYGDPPVNVAVECADCQAVLFSFDKEEEIFAPDEKKPGICPFADCRHEIFRVSEAYFEDRTAKIVKKCQKCGRRWTEVYKFDHMKTTDSKG